MKQTYKSPNAKLVDLSAEGNLLSLSLGEGGPGINEKNGGVNKGSELTRQQDFINTPWDDWSE